MLDYTSSNSERHDSALASLHTTTPFPDFNEWFISILEEVKPAIIVAIARGAIRLLQMQNPNNILFKIPVISDHALPFIPDSQLKSKRILVFDDSVIYGSTLSNIVSYLSQRKAVVICAAYIIDRHNFYGEQEPTNNAPISPSKFHHIPIRAKHKLWPNEIRRHHATLIRFLLNTPRDYNVDFPAFSFKLPDYSATDIPYIVNLLKRASIVRKIYDVSSPLSTEGNVYRYSVLLEPLLVDLFGKNRISLRAYSKARITFIPTAGEFRLTPVPQLSMAENTHYGEIKVKNKQLSKYWKALNPPENEGDMFYQQAIFRLATSFAAVIMGQIIARHFISALKIEFPIESIQVVNEDLKVITGENNTSILLQTNSFLQQLDRLPNLADNISEGVLDWDEHYDAHLPQSIAGEWYKQPWLKPNKDELIYEILGKVFLTLRAVTDNKECRKKNPDVSRLDVGLSYEGIRHLLLNECGIALSPEEVSLILDICVDHGQAVPKVIKQKHVWLRAFYSGEAEDAQEIMQLKNAAYIGYKDYLQVSGDSYLSPFDVHKLFATLKDIFPWLPISTKFYTFGRFATIGKRDVEIIKWLVNPGSGPLQLSREGKKRILKLQPEYIPCVNLTWEPEDCRNFYDAFQYIAMAFSRFENDGPKLLLSTCRTHRHTYNAVAVEAHSWVQHNQGDFEKVLNNLRLNDDNSFKNLDYTINSLYWCARYLTEARKKYEIFYHKFGYFNQQIEQEFIDQGQSATRFWQFAIRAKGILDASKDTEIEYRFNFLMPLINQMIRITSFLTGIILKSGILSEERLEDKFASEGISLNHEDFGWFTNPDFYMAALEYNRAIEQKRVTCLSREKTLLPIGLLNNHNFSADAWNGQLLATVYKCYEEIRDSLNVYCPEYDVSEGDFPYSPDTKRRILKNGSTEIVLDNAYVLTMDVIGSSDSVKTNEFKDFILQTFERFRQHPIYFEKTGNDAFIVCCIDPIVLWDIARAITIQGEMLKGSGGPLGGTRKGLYYGTVSIVKDTHGSIIIRDWKNPKIVSMAFSILSGVDQRCHNTDLKNRGVIIEKSVAEQLAPIVNLDFNSEEAFPVASKHFHGQCYFVQL